MEKRGSIYLRNKVVHAQPLGMWLGAHLPGLHFITPYMGRDASLGFFIWKML